MATDFFNLQGMNFRFSKDSTPYVLREVANFIESEPEKEIMGISIERDYRIEFPLFVLHLSYIEKKDGTQG